MPGKKRGGGGYSDRGLAAALGRISKAKRAAGVMKRARSIGLMSHPASKYGVRYVPSGTSEGVDAYGVDYKSATEAQRMKRKADGYYGRGEYWGKAIGGMLGQYSGIPGAGAALGYVGDKVGDWFKRKFGHRGRGLYEGRGASYSGGGLYEGRGSYVGAHVGTNNSLIAGGHPNLKFHGEMDETSGLTISHTEFVGDVFAPSNSSWSIGSYALNPGLQEVFPLLSQFAVNFEEYEFIQLVFHYRSTVDSSAVTNASGNTGTIIMATDYSSSVQNFKEKSQMVNSHGAIAERITEAANHGIECDPSKNMGSAQKSVRTGAIRDRDVSTLDHGKFQIAFQNTPTPFYNQQVGELWVTYTCKLDKPRIYSAAAGNVAMYRGVSKGGSTGSLLKGTNFLTGLNNSLAVLVTQSVSATNNALKITFPAAANGTFEVNICIEGTGMTIAAYTSVNFLFTGNVVGYNDLFAGGNDAATPASFFTGANSGTSNLMTVHVQVQAASGGIDNSITIPLILAATTVQQTDVRVIEISPYWASSNTQAAPVFVDSLGVVTQP